MEFDVYAVTDQRLNVAINNLTMVMSKHADIPAAQEQLKEDFAILKAVVAEFVGNRAKRMSPEKMSKSQEDKNNGEGEKGGAGESNKDPSAGQPKME